ncbi:unnamed protein product (macronuclear) [Paramecium tetraurelia]|uniref:Uncharacterized protein n=1 Tax=Paramecium tetraurelia TaxID=5888 RepID=A0EDM1_PARTE|nr:uncharacterized protein GSPATT00025732001 [Paramecium tetraurelia]CAK93388.1 unnamed protein product [Paramecium tetraurelia]|eukprot:XP_001460785.1 hypothetical protein (macronuclear) [Paramecium tetraurelia strain d4-2]
MKTYEFELNNKRNVQREELFILTIVERVLAGFLSSISFVDQAQFCELLSRKQKEKKSIQALHLQILGTIKRNLLKNQSPIKDHKTNYEIRTVVSQSIDSRKNYICLSSKKKQDNKEQQTTEIETQFYAQPQSVKSRRFRLDKASNQDGRLLTNGSYQQNDSTTTRAINPFQLNSPNSTQADNQLKDLSIQKQFTSIDSNFKIRNLKPTINIVSQDGEIEKQVNYKSNFNQQQQIKGITSNQNIAQKQNQPYLEPQLNQQSTNGQSKAEILETNLINESINPQAQSYSRKQSQNLPMGSDSSKMDLKEKLQKYYSNDDDFSSSRRPMTQSDRLKQITYGTHTELPYLGKDGKQKQQTIQSAKCLDKNQEQVYLKQSKQDKIKQQQKSEKQDEQSNPLMSLKADEIEKKTAFLSPPQSSRTLQSGKSTKTKLKTVQSNEQKIAEIQQYHQQNSTSKEESQISLLDQSLHKQENVHSHFTPIRPATTHIEANTQQQDYPQFQTHDNIDQQSQKYQQTQLMQQISMTSIMHDDEHNSNMSQQINIQVNQCEPTQNTNNVIVEESIECSPMQRMPNQQHAIPSFNHLKLEDQKQPSASQIHSQQRQQISPSDRNQPSHSQIPLQQNQYSINSTQSRMLIPINNTQNSAKNTRSTTKQKSQLREQQQQQQQRSDESQPESKLTIESSQGEKSNRSKAVKNAKQLKLPVAAAALNFARRKSSNQNSPHDPKKMEQLDKERQRQMEYQKQLEKMKYERELMEQYKIPDNMPLSQKRAIIEQLINQLESIADQDVKYQIMLCITYYVICLDKQRQEQIQNAAKQELVFSRSLDNCYEELGHLSEQKLKILGKDDLNKIQFLKFEDQVQTSFPGQQKAFSQDINSPIKKNLKFLSKLDPVEIEKQMNRIKEFKQETEMLRFFQSFNSQYDKEVNQCDLDFPTEKDRQYSVDHQRGILPKTTYKRKKTKKQSTKLMISTYRLDPKKLDTLLQATDKIKSVGQFLL